MKKKWKQAKGWMVRWMVFLVAWVLHKTYRIRCEGLDNRDVARTFHPKGVYCVAVWHEFALPCILAASGTPHCILISASQDGSLADLLARKFGFFTVRGSASRKSTEAILGLHRYLEKGVPAAFTVDGSRGPRHKCKPGVLRTALHAGCAVVPVSIAIDRAYELGSWDRAKIPKPFARIVLQYGSPLWPETLQGEEAKALYAIEQALHQTEREANAWI